MAVACADAISLRSALIAAAWMSEKLGNGWIVSRSTSSGTRARIASVACCIHSRAPHRSLAPMRSARVSGTFGPVRRHSGETTMCLTSAM